jgi:hypothetical protein
MGPSLVALAPVRDLLLYAKHLFVAARDGRHGRFQGFDVQPSFVALRCVELSLLPYQESESGRGSGLDRPSCRRPEEPRARRKYWEGLGAHATMDAPSRFPSARKDPNHRDPRAASLTRIRVGASGDQAHRFGAHLSGPLHILDQIKKLDSIASL